MSHFVEEQGSSCRWSVRFVALLGSMLFVIGITAGPAFAEPPATPTDPAATPAAPATPTDPAATPAAPATPTSPVEGTPVNGVPTNGAISNPTAQSGDESIASQLAGKAIGFVATWFGNSVAQTLQSTIVGMDLSSSPTVYSECIEEANGVSVGCWFTGQYNVIKNLAFYVMLPIALVAIIQAVTRGSLFIILKSMAIMLPIAIIGSVVGAQFVQLLLMVTDDICHIFQRSTAQNAGVAMDNVVTFLTRGGLASASVGILMIILSIPLFLSCIAIWFVLLLRSASIYIATLFLPMGFAMLIWPTTAKSFRKMCVFLASTILAKVAIVGSFSLAMSMFSTIGVQTYNTDVTAAGQPVATNAAATSGASGGAVSASDLNTMLVFTAAAIPAMFAQTIIFKFLDNFGFSEAGNSMIGMLSRPSMVGTVLATGRFIQTKGMLFGSGGQGGIKGTLMNDIPARRKWAAETSGAVAALSWEGIYQRDNGIGTHGYELDEADLDQAGISDAALRRDILDHSYSNDPNRWRLAHLGLAAGSELKSIGIDPNGNPIPGIVRESMREGQPWRQVVLGTPFGDDGQVLRQDVKAYERMAQEAKVAMGANETVILTGLSGANNRERTMLGSLETHFTTGAGAGLGARIVGGVQGEARSFMRNTVQEPGLNLADRIKGGQVTAPAESGGQQVARERNLRRQAEAERDRLRVEVNSLRGASPFASSGRPGGP